MAYLSDILQLMDYTSEKEHIAYVKLLAYRGAFRNPLDAIKKDENKTRNQNAFSALKIWEQMDLKEKYCKNIDSIINDTEAKELLNITFNSLEDGFNWLSYTADLFFLRDSFFEEGVGINKEKPGLNAKRWLEAEKIKNNEQSLHLFDCLKELSFVSSQPWPEKKKIEHVVLISNLDSIVKEQIAFIKNFSGKLYCLTGPRGLFNFESPLASILAEWFEVPKKVDLIQHVLDKHQDKTDPLQWTMDLTSLKKEILTALELKDWPKAEQSFYYQNQLEYDTEDAVSEREKLNCLNGPWPVAMDLISYYIKKYDLTDVQLVPIVALGKNGRINSVDDALESWYKQYGKNILLDGEQPIFLGCNKIHYLPSILNSLMNNNGYQHTVVQRDLSKKVKIYCDDGNPNPSDFQISNPLLIVGPSSTIENFNLQHGLDALSKALYRSRTSIKKTIFEHAVQKNNERFSQVIFVEKMIHYHQQRDHLRLANAAFDLALTFYFHHNLIKTSGLLQFAYNVLVKKEDKDVLPLIDQFDESTVMTTKHFIQESSDYPFDNQYSDIPTLKKIKKNQGIQLRGIREKIERQFLKVQNYNDIASLLSCNKICFFEMRTFLVSLMQQSIDLLQNKKLNYAYVYMGSYSKLQATPFSDLESFVIVENEHLETIELVKKHIKLLLLFIINLGETLLPSLGIKVEDKQGKQASLVGTLFDDYTRHGLCFDSYGPHAGKTPLGIKVKGKLLYRLIGTPESLVNKFILEGIYKDKILPGILSNSRFICGNEALYSKFLDCVKKQFVSKYAYAKITLEELISKYMNLLDISTTKLINHKYQCYTPVNVLIQTLYMMLPMPLETNVFERIDYLHQYALINRSQKNILKENVALSNYLRFHHHFKFREQKLEINKDDKLYPVLTKSNKKLKSIFLFFDQNIKQLETKRLKNEGALAKEYNEHYVNL